MRKHPREASFVLICCAVALLAAGCPKCPERMLSLDELVSFHNANAAAVPRLWARVKLIVTSTEGVTWGSPLRAPNGLLLLQKGPNSLGPHYFVLVGMEGGTDVFRLGSSPDEGVYYFWGGVGERAGAWYGRHEYAGAPGIEELPLDPNQLLGVLGIFELPDDFTRLPTVALAMSKDPYAYVVTYIDRQPVSSRVLFRREVYFLWSDGEPPRPFRVDLLDADGRRLLTARLKNYKTIHTDGDEGVETVKPVMPTDLQIDWVPWARAKPTQVRRIRMIFSSMTTTEKGDPRQGCRFWDNLPGGAKPVLVDQHIAPGRGEK